MKIQEIVINSDRLYIGKPDIVYHFTEIRSIPVEMITPTYRKILSNLTNTVNDIQFKNFAVGEVLFQGVSGLPSLVNFALDKYDVDFNFAVKCNTKVEVGDTVIYKKGWEYLWVRYQDAEDANYLSLLARQPAAVRLEQVYEYGNFSQLGIDELPMA